MSILDKVKEYWDRRPCNIRHSNAPVGTAQFFCDVEAKKYYVEGHIFDFADFKKWKGKKILEIGCGLGTETINFARAGAQVTAVDMSDESLEIAKKRAKVFGLDKRITFYQGNAEKLDEIIPTQKFDMVWSFGVVHHTPNPENVIKCIKEFMSPSTELRMMVYNKWSWKVFWILVKYGKGRFWDIDKYVAQNSEAQFGSPVTYTYSKQSVKKLLEGFNIEEIKIEHIFPYKIPEYKKHKYVFVWYFRCLPTWLFKWLEKRLGWHMCVKAKLKF
jgi:ubiquinone/menaquinone biosynthesis C-methylase UbiE